MISLQVFWEKFTKKALLIGTTLHLVLLEYLIKLENIAASIVASGVLFLLIEYVR